MTARAVTALPGVLLATFLLASLPALPARAADFDLGKLKDGGYVVLLRHVTAGGSDSDDFDLADCHTQRQVGAKGRSEAAALAARFKAAGIGEARVLSSQWCRAKQTAELLGLGPVTEEPALNYYHWRLGSKEAMNAALRGFLAGLEAPPAGPPLVLVSHSTAFGIMGIEAPPAGGGLVLKPNGTPKPEVVGEIPAPQ
jgi:phosphohistidine phosphatase SixA